MKRVSLKFVLFAIGAAICLILACLGCSSLQKNTFYSSADYTEEQQNSPAPHDYEDYYFQSVDVNITVSKSKTLAVRETINAVWNTGGKRSLIRDIQRESLTTRLIGGEVVEGKAFYTGISKISATLDGEECYCKVIPATDSFYDKNYHSIEMKHKDNSYLRTNRPYIFVLDYVYDMSADRMKGYDDLVFDILGYGMARTGKFTSTVTFPEGTELLPENVSVRTSRIMRWEPDESRGEYLKVEGNTVTVVAVRSGGYTLQVLLDEGYFNGHVYVIRYYFLFAALFLAAVAGLLVVLVKNMPKKPAVETVEFYPPEGVDIMRFSAIWHRKARSKDAAALILKWVGQGLITIESDGKNHFILRAQKTDSRGDDANGKPYCETAGERAYYNALFSDMGGGYNKFSTRAFGRASQSEREKLYYATKHLKEDGGEIIKPVQKVKYALPFLSLIPTLIMVIYICVLTRTLFGLFFIVFFIAGTFVSAMATRPDGVPIMYIFPVAFYAVPYMGAIFTAEAFIPDYAYLLYIAPVIYAVGNFILPFIVGRRTDDAQAVYGRLRGFKRFLLTAELSRISLLFDENPGYFADILPYCLIMGISKKVQKRFAALKNINVPVYVTQQVNMRGMSRAVSHIGTVGRPHSSGSGGGGGHGGGGGGHGGSHGGGGGGGGSRSR